MIQGVFLNSYLVCRINSVFYRERVIVAQQYTQSAAKLHIFFELHKCFNKKINFINFFMCFLVYLEKMDYLCPQIEYHALR